MDWRRRRVSLWLPLLAVAVGLAGCTDAITVYPVADALRARADVPVVAGKWIWRDETGSASVLTVEGNPQDESPCREGYAVFSDGSEVTDLGDDVCFVELNGYLVAELKTPAPYVFYRQYLVRIDDESVEVCGGFPIWVLLADLADKHPTGYSLEALAYTRRKGAHSEAPDLMVFTSQPQQLREFLETALPELASACDTGPGDAFRWIRFERMTEEEAQAADAAAQ